MRRYRKSMFVVVAILATVAVLVALAQGRKRAAPTDGVAGDAPIPVSVFVALQQPVPVSVSALGTVSASQTVTVTAQVGGQLTSVDFGEGERVDAGAVLARIDPRALQAGYDERAADRLQNQAMLSTARANYGRSNAPRYRQYVARTDLETQRSQVAQYEAAVAASEAGMRAAQVQLQHTRVVAPISGVAGLRNVDAGNVVDAGAALVTLTQIQPIHVLFDLPERQLQAVRAAQASGGVRVAALNRDDSGQLAEGRLDVVDNTINADSGTFRARATFANEDGALWPGQFVGVRMHLRTIANGVVVPAQAVLRGPDSEYVYVVQPDATVRTRPVTSGTEVEGGRVLVSAGLRAGERVVTEGQFRLKPGSRVVAASPARTPVPAAAGSARPPTAGNDGSGTPP